MLEPGEQFTRFEHLDAGGGELDGEREPVEAVTNLGDLAVRGEARMNGFGTLAEELNGLGLGERRNRELPLPSDVQRLPARHEQPQLAARAQKGGHVWDSCTTCSKLSSATRIRRSPTCSASSRLAPSAPATVDTRTPGR